MALFKRTELKRLLMFLHNLPVNRSKSLCCVAFNWESRLELLHLLNTTDCSWKKKKAASQSFTPAHPLLLDASQVGKITFNPLVSGKKITVYQLIKNWRKEMCDRYFAIITTIITSTLVKLALKQLGLCLGAAWITFAPLILHFNLIFLVLVLPISSMSKTKKSYLQLSFQCFKRALNLHLTLGKM